MYLEHCLAHYKHTTRIIIHKKSLEYHLELSKKGSQNCVRETSEY